MDQVQIDVLRYGKYYNMFFATGMAALLICGGLIVFIGVKKYQRYNPIGIMFNLLFIQIMLSIRIFLVGLFYQIWQANHPLIPYREYDFISLQVDGKTEATFYCSFEGLYYYAFHLAEILWGVLWLYDISILVKRPGLYTGKYLMYYSCVAYFFSFGFSIVVYFQDQDNFTSAANLMCLVVDSDSLGYYLFFNIPIALYFIAFLFCIFKFERGIMRQKPVDPNDQEQLIPKSTTALSPALYNKVRQNIILQRIYFILWMITVIPDFFLITERGMQLYSIFNCLHPIVIIVVIIRAISVNAQSLERQVAQTASKDKGMEAGNTEMSDYSQFSEDRSDLSQIGLGNDGSQTHTYRQVDNQAFADSDLNQKIITKDQLNNFRDIIKNHVQENILMGFQASIQEKEKPKHLYDKNLGFGEAPANQQLGGDPAFQEQTTVSGLAYLGKHLKEFFKFKTQATAAQISVKDPNAEALVLEGLVLGHPDILRKFNITIKQADLEKQSKIEKVMQGTNAEQNCTFDFIELAPEIFQTIRKIQNVEESLVRKLFSPENAEHLKVTVSQSKGGSFFILPDQGGLIIKSITKASYKLIQEFLPDYYRYLLMNPSTYITPIFGVYTLNITKHGNSLPVYFIIQRNVMGLDYHSLEDDDITFAFDIKGQVHGRKTLESPRDLLNFECVLQDKEKYENMLKDQDFLQSFKKLEITQMQSEKILSQLEADVEILNKHGFMDYSLKLVVVIKPFKNVDYFTQGIQGFQSLEEQKQEDHSITAFNKQSGTSKCLLIGELDPRLLTRVDDSQLILLKEQTKTKNKIFHICDQYDISSIKYYEEERKKVESYQNRNFSINKGTFDQDPLQAHTESFRLRTDADDKPDSFQQTANFNSDMIEVQQKAEGQLIRTFSVVNFIKTNLSYEFAQKFQDVEAAVKKQEETKQAQPKHTFGFGAPPTVMQQFNQFFQDETDDQDKQMNIKQNDVGRKLKDCYICKNQKMNHLVKEFANPEGAIVNDEIRKLVSNLSPRDVIEQVVFDQSLGIVKREIHFGIIDYITTYPMKKRLEELIHQHNSRQITAVKPQVYSERFIKTMKKIFQ